MAQFRGHLGNNMVVLYVMYILNAIVSSQSAEDWYIGCYRVTSTSGMAEDGVSLKDPVTCSKHCFSISQTFTVLSNDTQCGCSSAEAMLNHSLPDSECDQRCGGSEAGSFPCGGNGDTGSVYMSAGPFIYNITSKVLNPLIYTNQRFTIEVQIYLASQPNVSLGVSSLGFPGDPRRMAVSWTVDGLDPQQENITLTGPRQRHELILNISAPATHSIEIEVRNILGEAMTSLNVTVLPPVPSDLQVTLRTANDRLPTCVPGDSLVEDNTKTVSVFAAEPVLFEATVAIGYNLTFDWFFADDDSHVVQNPYKEKCQGRQCTTSIQEHMFKTVGQYLVTVNASNTLASLQDTVLVMVVKRELTNLTFVAHKESTLVAPPHTLLCFQVSMETTSRHNLTLQVNFGGDGGEKEYNLEQVTSTEMLNDNGDGFRMLSSYTNGDCQLTLELRHIYTTQGEFDPRLVVSSPSSTQQVQLGRAIHIINKLIKVDLIAPAAVAINQRVNITASTTSTSNVTYFWSVVNDGRFEEHNITTKEPLLRHEFIKAGIFTVHMEARNPINSVDRSVQIKVLVPITGLSISSDPYQLLRTGEQASFSADLDSGTMVEYEWDFADSDGDTYLGQQNLSAFANHTFTRPGKYNVSVRAYNAVSNLTAYLGHLMVVQDPVVHMDISFTSPVLINTNVTLEVKVIAGTDVMVYADFGQGPVFQGKVVNGLVNIVRLFTKELECQVTVTASNNVSSLNQTLAIQVQKGIGKISVFLSSIAILAEPVIFTVYHDNVTDGFSYRDDLIYSWSINGEIVNRTRVPVIDTWFSKTGHYNISVTAANDVASATAAQPVTVEAASSEPRFANPAVALFNHTTSLILKNLPAGPLNIHANFGDNDSDITNNVDTSTITLEHMYISAGVYAVDATISSSSRRSLAVNTYISVQEPIVGLHLIGPAAVPLNRSSVEFTWQAEVEKGSHVLLEWFINNQRLVTSRSKLNWRFTQVGIYNVSVRASNSLAWLVESSTVTVEYTITKVQIQIRSTVRGVPTDLVLTVYGGPLLDLSIDYGDGNTVSMSSAELKGENLTTPTEVIHRYQLSYNYTDVGIYEVSINVSNQVSWLSNSSRALVEEPIEGVQLTSDSPQIVRLGQTVAVRVTIASGNNLTCDWDFSDTTNPPPDMNCNESTATHIFSAPGNYTVKVFVTSQITALNTDPVEARLPWAFIVVQEIRGLTLQHKGNQSQAKLVQGRNQELTTSPIQFVARIDAGSDVVYRFNFSDGSIPVIVRGEGLEATVTHSFTVANAYNITVNAQNLLSNVTVSLGNLFYVQVAPSGLQLDRTRYFVDFGNSTLFQASQKQGTNLTYVWNMGDGQTFVEQRPFVEYQYKNLGQFTIILSAKNEVGSIEIKAQVDVIEPLQGVGLKASRLETETNEKVTFTALPYPSTTNVDYYEWSFTSGETVKLQTKEKTCSYNFTRPGWYTVHVQANTTVRSKLSDPIRVQVVERLSTVDLQIIGEQLIHKELKFQMRHFRGSDVTYTWNFGDGGNVIENHLEEMRYTYNRTGAFSVIVMASNILSTETVTRQVFILLRQCRPPVINILSATGARVYRSADLKVEAEVTINCSITSSTKFQWTLYDARTNQPLNPPSISRNSDAIFYLPPRSISYGNYTLNLTVEMNNTSPRVYSTSITNFTIIKSPLLPVIAGGIQRQASRQENVTLDSSTSSDPDNDTATDFVFEWSCYQLIRPLESCFEGNVTMMSWVTGKQDRVTVPGSAFNTTVNDFVVGLSMSMKDRAQLNTSQVLTMQKKQLLNVQVICPECKDGIVNTDQKMALYAVHRGLSEEEVTYSWMVYSVLDGVSTMDDETLEGGSCVKADGSPYHELQSSKPNDNVNVSSAVSLSTTDSKTDSTTTTTTTTSTTTTTTTTSTTTTTTAAIPLDPSFPLISEGTSSGGRGSAGGEGRGEGFPIRESGMGEGLPAIGEASPGEAGSTGGRGQPGHQPAPAPSEGSTGGRNIPATPNQDSGDTRLGDPAIDTINHTTIGPHIVSHLRTPVRILDENTTTGLDQKALVIKKGFLKQGTAYVIEVEVKDKQETRVGKALGYFKVNKSPSKGACSMKPDDKGIEMQTDFRIHCMDWKDTNTYEAISPCRVGMDLVEEQEELMRDLPIQYEVSYRLSEDSAREVIYRGLNHVISFQLPAGPPSHNHTVIVYISVLDSLGARTEVCSLPIIVTPKNFDTSNKTEEQILYAIVKGDESPLQTYVSSGDNRNVRLQTQLVANRLNRLSATEEEEQREIRIQIREAMLEALHDLPMRDEYEVQQTTSAVASSTAVTDELEVASLQYASDILEKAVRQVETLASQGKQLDTTSISSLTIDGAAHILAAITTPSITSKMESLMTTLAPMNEWLTPASPVKEVVQKSKNAVHTVLKSEMQQWVVGERPFIKDTPNLFTEAGRYRASLAYTSQSQLSNFVLPSNMVDVLDKNVKTGDPDCYQAHMLTFRTNPYIYSRNKERQVQTQVASLTLFTCDGQELSVADLPPDDLVNMHIPHQHFNSQEIVSDWLVLHKHYMNVHQFNVSKSNQEQSLHIHIELEPVPNQHVFPISILLGENEPPNPQNHFLQKNFGRELDNLKVYVEANTLKAGMQYYLGVVDVEFNAGRPREGEVTDRHYRLWLWWGDCLYWKEESNEWSPEGCHVSPSANYSHIQCNCNHLTSFGAHFSLAPNDLSFADVEDFFDLHENPVTFVFILCLLALYFLLLVICIKLDRHDAVKGSIVHLVDNKPTDKQTYMVTLETGFRKGAGTTAKVSLVLHGEDGMSEMRELVSESGQLLFERNSRDTFIVTLRESLGKVWKVQLWHNNVGPSPSWYLSRVTVKDLVTGQTYYFSCEKWFAVEEDDGKIEREIMLQEGNLGFGKVLWGKGTQYFADFHLWLSVFSRPSYSRFTRAQRLTCCLSLLLSYMAVNAAWYQYKETEYRGEFGLIDISWRSVFVGIITSVLVLPANFIITLIFRRSKVRKVRIEEFPEKKYYGNKRDSFSSLDSTVRLLQPVVTQSIFDQSMLNWAKLQEWAQRQWAKRYQQSVNSSLQNVKPPHPQQVQMAGDGQTEASPVTATETVPVQAGSPSQEMPQAGSSSHSNRSSIEMSVFNQQLPGQNGQQDRAVQDGVFGRGDSSNNSFSIATSSESHNQQQQQGAIVEGLRSGKSERCFLPCWCTYIAWTLCVLIILGCATITILYGFRFGRAKSIMWIQSLFFSFLQCVFITHPFIILIISVVTAIRYHDDLSVFDHHNDGVIETFQEVVPRDALTSQDSANQDEFDLATGIAERQRSRYLRFARPPQEKHLIEARKTTLKQKKTGAVFSESLSFSILLFLLLIVAFGKDSQTPFRLNMALDTLLTKSGDVPFEKVQTIEQWWNWTQGEMLDLLYWDHWYNGKARPAERTVGNSHIVGRISVRQKRVDPSPCNLPGALAHIFTKCHPGYKPSVQQTSWLHVANKTWHYKRKDQTGAACIEGHFAYYDSSGYQVFLPTTRQAAQALLQELRDYEWLDQQTRVVMVEFTLFHAPSNLFSSVHLMLEVPPLGRAFAHSHISSAYVYKYISHFDNFLLACELLLIIFTMVLVHSEVESAIKMKKDYIKNPWNCIQVTMLSLLVAYIACYIYRYVLVGDVVNALRSSYNEEYIDTSFIAYWDHLLKSFLGFIIFLLLVQSLRLLRNRPLFAKFGAIYRKAVYEVITFAGLFVVWTCAYTSLGVALYSAVSLDFSRWDSGLGTVVGLMTRYYNLHDLERLDPTGTRFYVISFIILALSSLTAYIVAVLTYYYKRYHSNSLPPLSTVQAVHYLWNRLLMMTQLQKPPIVHEDDGVLPPEFTMAEIEYQVEEMLFKMNALAGTSGLPDKPNQYFTDSDCTYAGMGEDAVSSGSEPRFDDCRFERRIHKIEDNLVTNEPHLAQLLQLDAIGAHILSAEHEKQLRSQLELEIFRQLQLQRPDTRMRPEQRLASISSSASKQASSSSGCQGSAEASPSTSSPPGHSHKLFFPQTAGTRNKRVHAPGGVGGGAERAAAGSEQVKMSDGLLLQELKTDETSGGQEPPIPLHNLKKATAQKASPSQTRRVHEDHASGSSCSSGAAEIQFVLDLQKAREQAKENMTSAMVGKPRKVQTDKSGVYESLNHSSSGSDGEVVPSKARSLRKTKSRGKGKGNGRLTGLDDLGDFAFDNHAFSSGSDAESKKDSSKRKRH